MEYIKNMEPETGLNGFFAWSKAARMGVVRIGTYEESVVFAGKALAEQIEVWLEWQTKEQS